ncbi:hypothetical protein [Ekhidna sp.]|uniref:hypothetical protein n=1 Tax=Ekhidna sp. TaxID=2608089 RepID=UPI003BAD73F9
MKNNIFIPIIAFLLINACNQSEDPIPEITSTEYTVKLNLGGDITFNDSPLNGRIESNEEQTYYMVQIMDLGGGVHASGVFSTIPQDLEVTLFKDREYSVEIAAYRKGSSYGLWLANDSTFYMNFGNRTITNRLTYGTALNFNVSQSRSLRLYNSPDSTTYTTTSSSSSGAAELDGYYGKINFDSTSLANDSVVSIGLVRHTMGSQTTVKNLTSGVIDISIAGLSKRFSPGEDSIDSKLFIPTTMPDDSSFYSRNFAVYVWHRDTVQGIAVNTTLYSNLNVPFKRLHNKIIEITAPVDTTGGANDNAFGFNISLDDSPLITGDSIIVN